MSTLAPHVADRVEVFIAAIDAYELQLLNEHEDAFRIFARYASRSIDGRYLERHPAQELLPDLENIMASAWHMPDDKIIVRCMLSEGVEGRKGALLACMPDQNFIFSILRIALESLGLKTYRTINTVIPIARDEQRQIVSVGTADAVRESFIWMEVDANQLAIHAHQLERLIRGRLHASRTVVEDFEQLTHQVQQLSRRFERLAAQRPEDRNLFGDHARLLNWLLNDNFVFQGIRYMSPDRNSPYTIPNGMGNYGTGRLIQWEGVITDEPHELFARSHAQPPYLWIKKSDTESWMYRSGRNDQICVQYFDDQGQPNGWILIEGLFSYIALSGPRTSVPVLDRCIERLYSDLQVTKGSHRYRTVRNAFNSLPLEYLFGISLDDIRKLVEQVLAVDAQHRIQVHMTWGTENDHVFVFVALPRSYFSEECRTEIRYLLKDRLNASSIDDGVYVGNLDSVTFHFYLTCVRRMSPEEQAALKLEIEQLASPWSDRLADELHKQHPANKARRLHNLYHEAFSLHYREETSVARAVEDILILENIHSTNPFDCDVYQELSERALGITRVRMFQTEPIILSDILPILHNLGLIVIDQFASTVHIPGRPEYSIATFRIKGVAHYDVDIMTRRIRLRNAIVAIVRGLMPNESLNRLLLCADIPWPSVMLMYAYDTYARQLGLPYGKPTVVEAFLQHTDVVRSLTELFRSKFDPEMDGVQTTEIDDRRKQWIERARRAVLLLLEGVEDLTSDQILRTFYHLVEATVRTNVYTPKSPDTSHIVLKFNPSEIPRIQEPKPFREILVFHPDIAGLHLRGGPVARGGIRWSDRLLDFRKEVLGLMATQDLKNVLIVPRGAKGAYVLHHPVSDPISRRAQADKAYKVFIGGLLEVTDNWVDGAIKTPQGVLCYDEPDPYLVVAADKGTAHLSDTANGLARDRKFWLGDAFASGGSQGYDHKKEAITSRGAWACVRRHFRELGLDPEIDKIKVVGIGDMSGDVFGNGMLRSQTIQLIAAFDHRHIFIDPNPDPYQSYLARKKLFNMPRSAWTDYPSEQLSPGGGIYPRGAKSIVLSPAALSALGLSPEDTQPKSGPEVVQAILSAPVDLLWNGGIGTYIRSSEEHNHQVGDPTNDDVRVHAKEVRAKVIGEGGNLGVTTQGRIELAILGVKLNTDAVDNSAGVDLSDHEVNLKLLFQRQKERQGFSDSERNDLLEQLREEIGHIVVGNNSLQSRMISLDERRSQANLPRFMRAAYFLAERTPFDYQRSSLPHERTVKLRIQRNEGLFRPEIAFLSSNAKADLRRQLTLDVRQFSLEKMKDYLFSYFPPSLHNRFHDAILNHPVALDIARTVLTNCFIADVGVSFLPEMIALTGLSTSHILLTYLLASDLLNTKHLKECLDKNESKLAVDIEYRARLAIEDALERTSIWLLMHPQVDQNIFKSIFQDVGLYAVQNKIFEQDLFQEAELRQLPTEVAGSLQIMLNINHLLDIALLALEQRISPEESQKAWFDLGETTQIFSALRWTSPVNTTVAVDDLELPARSSLHVELREILHILAKQWVQKERPREFFQQIGSIVLKLESAERPLSHLVMAISRIRQILK